MDNSIISNFQHYAKVTISDEFAEQLIEQLEEAKISLEKSKKERELKEVQDRNKRLRGLIDHVVFSGPVTVVKWNDGTLTKVRCADDEEYDAEKGLLAAMAKKLYENTNIFVEELARWCQPKETEIADRRISAKDYYFLKQLLDSE